MLKMLILTLKEVSNDTYNAFDFNIQTFIIEQLIARKEGITIFGLGTENYSEILLQIPCTKKAWCDVYLFLKSALNEEIAASTTTLFIQSVTFAKYDVETIDTELSAGLYVLHSSIHARWTVAVKNHISICQSLSNSEKSTPCPTPKKSTSSSQFPKCIVANYDKCVICNYSRTSILESAHIVDFSRFNNGTCSDEVNDLLHTLGVNCMKNGIRLCPTCHSSFGKGEISLVDLSSDGIKMCVVLCIEEEDDPAIKLMYHLVKASIALDDVADSINPHPMLVKFHLQNSIAKFLRPAVPTSLKAEADVSDDELSDDDHHTAVQVSCVIVSLSSILYGWCCFLFRPHASSSYVNTTKRHLKRLRHIGKNKKSHQALVIHSTWNLR